MRKRRVTLEDVARHVGVSKSTVSMAVNNWKGINKFTSQRVLEAVKQLGYTPNGVARSLRKQRSHVLGLVLPDVTNPFFPEVAKGVIDAARRQGYSVVLCDTNNNPEEEETAVRVLMERRVDGIVLVSAGREDDHLSELKRMVIPAILVDRQMPDASLPEVLIDNLGGARSVVKHLIDHGHRKIGFISGPLSVPTNSERYEGYKAALRKAGIRLLPALVAVSESPATGEVRGLARKLLDLGPDRPTAIFAFSDVWAAELIRELRRRGMHVPEHMLVVGFDDSAVAAITDPPLTTVAQPKYHMGVTAVERILAVIRGEKLEDPVVKLPTRLVVRQSCGCQGSETLDEGTDEGVFRHPPAHSSADPAAAATLRGATAHSDTDLNYRLP